MAVITIDFDGTIVEEKYPAVGTLYPHAKDLITRLFEYGHDIIINTCRAGVFEGMAEEFLNENEIPFNYINCNLPEKIEHFGRDCRKISADVDIDDKQLGGLPRNAVGEVDWLQIESMLIASGIYTHNTEPVLG